MRTFLPTGVTLRPCLGVSLIAASKSVTFSLYSAAMTVGGIINNPIANLLMRKSPWLSIYVGTALQVFSTLLGFSLPETLQTKKPSATLDTSDSEDYEQGNADGDHDQRISHQALLQAKVGTRRFFNFVHLAITQNRQVGLLLLSMLFTTFGRDAALMLTQYVHFRFGWGWGEVMIDGPLDIVPRGPCSHANIPMTPGRARRNHPASSWFRAVHHRHPTSDQASLQPRSRSPEKRPLAHQSKRDP